MITFNGCLMEINWQKFCWYLQIYFTSLNCHLISNSLLYDFLLCSFGVFPVWKMYRILLANISFSSTLNVRRQKIIYWPRVHVDVSFVCFYLEYKRFFFSLLSIWYWDYTYYREYFHNLLNPKMKIYIGNHIHDIKL